MAKSKKPNTRKHVITYSTRDDTWEGSHGYTSTHTYDVATCSCGWTTEVYRSFDDEAVMPDRVRDHKIDVLLAAAGITFEETKAK